MPLEAITYNHIVTAVKTWIKSNCSNISNYTGMSGAVKNGYTYTIATINSTVFTETATASLTSPITAAIASAVVDTDMNNYLTSAGINSFLNTNISADNFFKFINDIMVFCTTKLGFVTSQSGNSSSSSVRYLVYCTGNTTYNNSISLTKSSATQYLIKANDVQSILQYIINNITNNIRVLNCKFNFSIT